MKSVFILAGIGVFLALATVVFVAALLTPALDALAAKTATN